MASGEREASETMSGEENLRQRTEELTREVARQASILAELEQDRLLLQVLMDTIPDSVYFKDLQSRFVRVNRSTLAKFGVQTPEELVGRTDFDFFSAEHAGEAYADERRILETGRAIIGKEEKETWPDGTVSWVSTTKVPVRNSDGTLVGTFGLTRDITIRKRAQIALEASERRYRELVENANDIIYTHDLEGRILSINKAAELVSGYTRDEAKNFNVGDLVAPGHLKHAMEMIRRKVQGIPTTTYEIDMVGKDGRLIPLEVSTQVLFEEGRAIAIQGIGRDITDRKRANEALRQQAHLLAEQTVALEDRNRELSKALRDLQDAEAQLIHSEKIAAIGQLVAGLAHEINNPAAFVLTNLTTVAQDIEDLLSYLKSCESIIAPAENVEESLKQQISQARESHGVDEALREIPALLESCRSGMHRIRDLVTSLRSYSRIDVRGTLDMASLLEGIEATLVLVRPMIPKGVVVEIDCKENPVVECNLGQVNQVIMNLLVNAVHAVGAHGRIVVTIERKEDGVQVRVADDGPGIPPAIRKKVFDPFFTTKDVGQGTGLGLSICQRIVDSHRGRIELETEEGKGTEFRVWLPGRQVAAGQSAEQRNG